DGVGILGAVHAVHADAAWMRLSDGTVELRFQPRHESGALFSGWLRRTLRRHHAHADFANYLFPRFARGVIGCRVSDVEALQGEAAGLQFVVMAGDAVAIDDRRRLAERERRDDKKCGDEPA